MKRVVLYDTTLRDGAQGEGLSFSVEDKLKITRKLDELGIPYIEGGWPGANPKDSEFFQRTRSLPFSQATLVAFGSTRRPDTPAEEDVTLRALLAAETKAVALVAKSWDIHVIKVLNTTLKENLSMIQDSVRFFKERGIEVIYDAEHFFDGFKANRDYALETLRAAAAAGADWLVLCDTNGGSIPSEIASAVEAVKRFANTPLGIHAHNDGELAVANSLAAVQSGAVMVQGTVNGYGERCGNANLCSIIPNLELKMGIDCLTEEQLARMTELAHYVSEVANLIPNPHQPYVGASAFAHKAGLHVDGVTKITEAYEHISPSLVGNKRRVLVSELGGKSNILFKAEEFGLDLSGQTAKARAIVEKIKQLESQGFRFEDAEASFELLVRRALPDYKPPFELLDFVVLVEHRPGKRPGDEILAEASVKLRVGGEIIHTAAEGDGPVNALDRAARKALLPYYQVLANVRLVDYKVRVLDDISGTGASVRVSITSTDGERVWGTVGGSANIIEASWAALADSLEYPLLKVPAKTTTVPAWLKKALAELEYPLPKADIKAE